MSAIAEQGALGPRLASQADFPMTRDIVYLNQAAIGLVPTPVLSVMQRFTIELGRMGTAVLDEDAEAELLDDVRRAAAGLIGAEQERIAIVSSASEALNQFAWWLKPGRGANVVLLDGDFPSVTLPWLRLTEETGLDVRFVPTRDDPALATVSALTEYVDAETAAICVGHVQYATGHRLDLGLLTELATAAGAYLVVDGTQSLGVVAVDVAETPVDLLVASSHKWLCAPHGAALVYIGRRLDDFRPPFVGWRGTVDQSDFDGRSLRLAAAARRVELGTIAYGAGLALAAGIDYLETLGRSRVETHDLSLAKRLADGLADLEAVIVTPPLVEQRAAIVTARFPSLDANTVVERLQKQRILAAARQGAIRFGLHVFNDSDDVDAVLTALRQEMTARSL